MAKDVRGYVLSEEDRDLLADVAQDYLGGIGNPPTRIAQNGHDPEDWLGPEVYVARTPEGGIPALTGGNEPTVRTTTGTGSGSGSENDVSDDDVGQGDKPGYADCAIYQRVIGEDGQPVMIDMGFSQTVHNLFNVAIAGNSWAVVARDKYGAWYVIAAPAEDEEDPPDDPPDTSCDTIEVVTNVCVSQVPTTGTGSGSGGTRLSVTVEFSTIDLSKACDDPARVVSVRCETDGGNCCGDDPPVPPEITYYEHGCIYENCPGEGLVMPSPLTITWGPNDLPGMDPDGFSFLVDWWPTFDPAIDPYEDCVLFPLGHQTGDGSAYCALWNDASRGVLTKNRLGWYVVKDTSSSAWRKGWTYTPSFGAFAPEMSGIQSFTGVDAATPGWTDVSSCNFGSGFATGTSLGQSHHLSPDGVTVDSDTGCDPLFADWRNVTLTDGVTTYHADFVKISVGTP